MFYYEKNTYTQQLSYRRRPAPELPAPLFVLRPSRELPRRFRQHRARRETRRPLPHVVRQGRISDRAEALNKLGKGVFHFPASCGLAEQKGVGVKMRAGLERLAMPCRW